VNVTFPTSAAISSTATSSGFVDFTLRQLRCAYLRSRCLTNEIETVGVSLRAGLVSPEAAIAAVCEAGGGCFLDWASS
jgi:hypothetical protein